MKKILPVILSLLSFHLCIGQTDLNDTTQTLEEVTIRSFEQNRKQQNTTIPVKLITSANSDRYNKSSLVNSFNSIAGVRMEERSPGSYRINIRGSSLRSPFGVRNIKVYWNDIPITDPGGNTYFNQFAWNNFSSIEIFKGPPSSLYGAGTGGLVLLNNFDRWQPGASLEYVTGSYNLQNVLASARFGKNENRNQVSYAHNQSDGYRVQTNMRRDNVSWISQLKLSDKQQLTASFLYTDMMYQTPGALTLAEYESNPKASRPAGGGFPSAVDAKATIYQKNFLAGLSNQYFINSSFKNTTTLYGSFSQVKNAAIRNYERRNEPHFGGRTVFLYRPADPFQLVVGGEFQQGYFNTQVSNNRNGQPDTLQTNDDVRNSNLTAFAQADFNLPHQWFLSAGLSVTRARVGITRLSVYPVIEQSRTYRNELAPRLAVSKKIGEDLSFIGSLSKGFSPPTVAELLPSTGVIGTDLEAEHGWNYEATVKYSLLRKSLQLELTAFHFKLEDALVQRRDLAGADFFTNAGDVRQRGIEFDAMYNYLPDGNGFVRMISLQGGYAYSNFRYGTFIKGTNDFSGKTIPSVPSHTISILADVQVKGGWFSNITYYDASKIYLNDANTALANGYHLLGWRLGWKNASPAKFRVSVYAGVDNLLDEQYSLGNDINAAGNRFYNAAAPRNYYVGVSVRM